MYWDKVELRDILIVTFGVYMKNKFILVLAGLAFASSAVAQSFCNASHSGTSKTSTRSYEEGNIGNYGYKIWYDGGNNSATFYSDGSFSCSFSNSKDYLCREGNAYDKTKTWQQLGHLYADFSVKMSNLSNIGYSYVGIYGWSVDPLIEWYIVDNWGSQYRPGGWMKKKGDIVVNGDKYEVYTNTQVNQPAITGGNTTFEQYFSIRTTARSCGTIDITAHFEAWDKLGLKLGKMYEAQILGEGGNTSGGASGKFDFNYAKVYIGSNTATSSASQQVSSSSEARAPFSGTAIAIPGIVEAENYDKGGNGVAYGGASEGKEDYATNQRPNDDIDIVGTESGYGVGGTLPNQWMEYTVNVKTAGVYEVEALASNGNADAKDIDLLIGGKNVATISVPNIQDDWGTYVKASGKTVALAAGQQVLRIKFTGGYTNLDYVKFSLPTVSSSSIIPSSSSVKVSSSSVIPSSASVMSSASVPSSSSVKVSSSSVIPSSASIMSSASVPSSSSVKVSSSSVIPSSASVMSSASVPGSSSVEVSSNSIAASSSAVLPPVSSAAVVVSSASELSSESSLITSSEDAAIESSSDILEEFSSASLVSLNAKMPMSLSAVVFGRSLKVYATSPSSFKVQVFDMMGNTIQNVNLDAYVGENILSLESLSQGQYVIRLTNKSASKVLRVNLR